MRKKLLSSALALTVLSVAMVGCNGGNNAPGISTLATDPNGLTNIEVLDGEEDSNEWFYKVREYYLEKQPEDRRAEQVYIEGIPGMGSFFTTDSGQVTFIYEDNDARFSYTLNIQTAVDDIDVSIDLCYPDETRFYIACQTVENDGLEEVTNSVLTGDWSVYDDSALATHSDEIETDAKIVYSRFVAFAKEALKDIDVSLEDYGIDFGSDYLSVDPKTPHSQEVVIVNDHVFENQVCTDCGESWFSYVYDTIGVIDHYEEGEEWHSYYGPHSPYQVGGADYTQFSSYGENLSIYYHNYDDRMDMTINLYQENEYNYDPMDVYFTVASDYVGKANTPGVVMPKIRYSLNIDCEPSELNEVLSSREAILEASDFDVLVYDPDEDEIRSASIEYDGEEAVNELIESVDELKLTKEEVADMLLANKDSFIKCFSVGLESLGTNFEDAGLPGLK